MAKLLPVVCPSCHAHLLDGPRGTQVYCQTCRRWVLAKQELSANDEAVRQKEDPE